MHCLSETVPTEQNHSVYAGRLSVNLWHQCQNANVNGAHGLDEV